MIFSQAFGGLIPGARGATVSVLLRTGTPLTGRQVHRLLEGSFSLRAVQDALKFAESIGLVTTETVGRARLHHVNTDHFAVAPLRVLRDPMAALESVIAENIDQRVQSVILFGSVARGEASDRSDIDLAVITISEWDGQADLRDAVQRRMGCSCDVLVQTRARFDELARAGEPVIVDILRDGFAVYGERLSTMRKA